MEPVAIVSQVGFPIAAFVMMWRLARNTMKEQTEAFQELAREVRSLQNEVGE